MPPTGGPNSFNFMQFLGKDLPNNSFLHPPLELAPPPRGNPGSATGFGRFSKCLVNSNESPLLANLISLAKLKSTVLSHRV